MHTQKALQKALQLSAVLICILLASTPKIAQAQTIPIQTLQILQNIPLPEQQQGSILIPKTDEPLTAARDSVWTSIGNSKTDEKLNTVIDNAHVNMSGIMTDNGKEVLFIGINEEAFEEEEVYEQKKQELRSELQKNFPGIPIKIESVELTPSIATTPRDQKTAVQETETSIFSEDFEDGLDAWETGGDSGHNWRAERLDERVLIDGYERNNKVAQAENCDDPCTLTLKDPIDLTDYQEAHLSFERFMDNSLDREEYLKMEVSTDGQAYTEIFKWTPEKDDDDNEWHHETYDLAQFLQAETFTMRFTSLQSSFAEETAIDNIQIAEEEPETLTQEECFTGKSEDLPLLGGDRAVVEVDRAAGIANCSTITLGGITTKDEKRGFIIAGHAATKQDFEDPFTYVGHTAVAIRNSGYSVKEPLGKITRTPFKWDFILQDEQNGETATEETAKQTGNDTILADAAFVEYPTTTRCEEEWLGVCLRRRYKEQVKEKTIRGDSETYTVTGSRDPRPLETVYMRGTTTSEERSGTVGIEKVVVKYENMDTRLLVNYVEFDNPSSGKEGDSGAPVYSSPNKDNEVEIMGIYSGSAKADEITFGLFSPWSAVERALDLQDI